MFHLKGEMRLESRGGSGDGKRYRGNEFDVEMQRPGVHDIGAQHNARTPEMSEQT